MEKILNGEPMADGDGHAEHPLAQYIPEAADWRPLVEQLPDCEPGSMLRGSVHAQWVRCGKPNCRCAGGELHGPYWYRFERQGGRLRKRYVPRAELDAVRQRCENWRTLGRLQRESRRRMALRLAVAKRYRRELFLYWLTRPWPRGRDGE